MVLGYDINYIIVIRKYRIWLKQLHSTMRSSPIQYTARLFYRVFNCNENQGHSEKGIGVHYAQWIGDFFQRQCFSSQKAKKLA